jgi:hypothetical protein
LPVWFTPLISNLIFEDTDKYLSFPAWCGYYYSLRIFFSEAKDSLFMKYDDFKGLIKSV